MWGTPRGDCYQSCRPRFIPTHVGNTSNSTGKRRSATVHPHACGEHVYICLSRWCRCGSSPRMWGTRIHLFIPMVSVRFIPTHVGNTNQPRLISDSVTVHPHACGEHKDRGGVRHFSSGSSPRMWGTLRAILLSLFVRRFIPTHVGNTIVFNDVPLATSVHPHACGEHLIVTTKLKTMFGSSPRMWGTPSVLYPSGTVIRFIPTHVGNTNGAVLHILSHPVHPHACGEHSK